MVFLRSTSKFTCIISHIQYLCSIVLCSTLLRENTKSWCKNEHDQFIAINIIKKNTQFWFLNCWCSHSPYQNLICSYIYYKLHLKKNFLSLNLFVHTNQTIRARNFFPPISKPFIIYNTNHQSSHKDQYSKLKISQ